MIDSSNKFNSKGPSGDFVLVNNGKVGNKQFYLYQAKIKGDSILRVIPPTENGELQPLFTNNGSSVSDLTDAFIGANYSAYLGTKKYHMLDVGVEGAQMEIIATFHSTIKDYVAEHPQTASNEWRRWLGEKVEGEERIKMPCLQAPRSFLFMQCLLYQFNGKPARVVNGQAQPRENIIFAISPACKNAFLEDICTPLDAAQPVSATNNKIGDIIGATGYRLKIEPFEKTFDNKRPPQTWTRAIRDNKTVGLDTKAAQARWVDWAEVLNYREDPTNVMIRLAETFSNEAVKFVFKDHPVYSAVLPPSLREQKVVVTKQMEPISVQAAPINVSNEQAPILAPEIEALPAIGEETINPVDETETSMMDVLQKFQGEIV